MSAELKLPLGDATMAEAADALAAMLVAAFAVYQAEFRAISRRAKQRWIDGDWAGHAEDVTERHDVHPRNVGLAVERASRALAGSDDEQRVVWRLARQRYAAQIAERQDSEIGETFFNSVTRRVFSMVGIDADLEFRWLGGIVLPDPTGGDDSTTFSRTGSTPAVIAEVLMACELGETLDDVEADAELAGAAIDRYLDETWETATPVKVDVLVPMFYRNGRAYIVGRIRHLNRISPMVLVLHRTKTGTRVDAVLLTENNMSRVFGFTRAYFHVDAESPARLVSFVKSLVPGKPVAELYTALGYSQHGKTQLVRGLWRRLSQSSDQFVFASGTEGMVMTVFTLPSFDVVFKVMKDRFLPPKRCTPQQVIAKYHLVFDHDKVGRMVDAQEFRNFALPRSRFSSEVLDRLIEVAGNSISVEGNDVVVSHLFTERRVHPLDLYLRTVDHDRAVAAALDYGQAIKDLAAAGIFPGDLFPKNFGVTRHGAVVFYDYDEIELVADTNFRAIPEARNPEEELSAQAWFSADADDVFPEEFRHYLRFGKDIQPIFNETHGDLATVDFWLRMKEKAQLAGPSRFFPYPRSARLRPTQTRDAAPSVT